MLRYVSVYFLLLSSLALFGCETPQQKLDAIENVGGDTIPQSEQLYKLVPTAAGGNWNLIGTGSYFKPENLANYTPEFDVAYNVFNVEATGVFHFTNTNPTEDVYCEINLLPGSDYAYALYTYLYESGREKWDDGDAGYRDYNGITFCAGPYYVRVMSLTDFFGSGAICDEIAYKVAKEIGETDGLPNFYDEIPGENLVSESVKFFIGNDQANIYLPQFYEGIDFDESTIAIQALYSHDEMVCKFVLIGFEDKDKTGMVFEKYLVWAEGKRSSAFYDLGVTYYFGAGPCESAALSAYNETQIGIVYDYGRDADFAKQILYDAMQPSVAYNLAIMDI